MTKKLKVALLNLYYDNNYGGNLQRYALVTVLQRIGCDVTYIYMRQNWNNRSWGYWLKKTTKQFVKHYILLRKKESVFLWREENSFYVKSIGATLPFMERYIPHSSVIYGEIGLRRFVRLSKFDAFVVGSDQVWRHQFTRRYGVSMWFLGFLPKNYSGKRIAYGASFGVEEVEFTKEEQDFIKPLYGRFDAVSVRELSGLGLLQRYGWISPQAQCVLDPTLLLRTEDYIKLIEASETKPLLGKMLCYVLDWTEEKERVVSELSQQLHMEPTFCSIKGTEQVSVEQWLRYFYEADFVVTDSYHGFVFSVVFNKPYRVFNNSFRGGTRFDSLFRILNLSNNGESVDWGRVNEIVDEWRANSTAFLKNTLCL